MKMKQIEHLPLIKPMNWIQFQDAKIWKCETPYGVYGVFGLSYSWDFCSHDGDYYTYRTETLDEAFRAAENDLRQKFAKFIPPSRELAVWYGSMPESNGKSNWTASVYVKGGDPHLDGFCLSRSEYPDRVRYAADRVRWIIGEIHEKPRILDYDADKRSGYVEKHRLSPTEELLLGLLEETFPFLDGDVSRKIEEAINSLKNSTG